MVRKRVRARRKSRAMFDIEIGGQALRVLSVPIEIADRVSGLSPAELLVARDAAEGLSNNEIARRRRRSVRTIANQLASVYKKLKVSSRAELAARLLGDNT
jgi:DNA-binding NarL/FixJ family response regulator